MSNALHVTAVVPARMGSSRFPGKPVVPIAGVPLVEHVRRRVALSEAIDAVIVATCDQEIIDTVERSGGRAVMTKNTHERCTDRVSEAAEYVESDIFVIVQGDEPLIDPAVLEQLVAPFHADASIVCTNLVSAIQDEADFHSVDVVKAVLAENNDIMYFSRAPVPYLREGVQRPMYRQTGVSAFTSAFLKTFSDLAPTQLEIAESVDFLRTVCHGYSIRGVVCNDRTLGVDRPEDIPPVEKILRENPRQRKLFRRITEG